MPYSLNKKEWICSLFKEWILEKSEIGVNLEWTFVLFTHFGVTSWITRNPWVIPVVTPKWVNNTNVHSKFTLISLFSKIHSLKSEHIYSLLLESRASLGEPSLIQQPSPIQASVSLFSAALCDAANSSPAGCFTKMLSALRVVLKVKICKIKNTKSHWWITPSARHLRVICPMQ